MPRKSCGGERRVRSFGWSRLGESFRRTGSLRLAADDEERGALRLFLRGLRRLGRNRPGVTAPRKYGLHRHQNIQQSFLPCLRTPAHLDRGATS